MAPKKAEKQEKPKDQRVKADLTFGLKNKKGGKGQEMVKLLQSQAAMTGKNKATADKEKEKAAIVARKLAEQRKKDEINSLFTPIDIVQPKIPFGVDPKTVLCAFFKAGRCQKGTKCKYSHDLADRKQQKASIYADQREAKEADTMDKWNDEKLQQVVSKKGNTLATTDIVCKFFIDAVETGRYGWFWECPDGGENCKYRHALPPGFILKSQRKKEEEDAKKQEITLEEFLEVEVRPSLPPFLFSTNDLLPSLQRHKLDQSKLTPLTPETFAIWKKTRMNKKDAEADAVKATKTAAHAVGKNNGMSGRDLFMFNPNLGEGESDGEDEDEEWDLQLLTKLRREREERELEVAGMRHLDGLEEELEDAHLEEEGEDEEEDEEEQEGEAEHDAGEAGPSHSGPAPKDAKDDGERNG